MEDRVLNAFRASINKQQAKHYAWTVRLMMTGKNRLRRQGASRQKFAPSSAPRGPLGQMEACVSCALLGRTRQNLALLNAPKLALKTSSQSPGARHWQTAYALPVITSPVPVHA